MSPAPDLSPHPLVTALGSNLGAQGSPLEAASVQFDNAMNQAAAGGGDGGGGGDGNGGGNGGGAPLGAGPVGAAGAIAAQRGTQQAGALASALAQDPNAPQLVSFAGYLGGVAATDASGDWRLFYFDWKLQTWLIVAQPSIVYRVAIQDPKWPFGQLDVIWVRREAAVGEGNRPLPPDIQGRFLRGDFTSAGDFRTDSVAGTMSASTGVFCDAESVGCCRFGTR